MNEELKEKLLKLIAEKPVNYAQCCCSRAYHELHDKVLSATKNFPQNIAFKTRIFWILNDITEPLKCCICGKIIDKDIGTLENGYNKNKKWEPGDEKFVACSDESCIRQARSVKIKNTCLEKYGVSNTYMVEQFKEKSKQTCMERYGVPYGGNSAEGRVKAKNTCMKNYGVTSPLRSDLIKQKAKRTCLEKYGQSSFTKTDEYRNLKKEKHIEKLTAQLFRDPEIEFLDLNEFQNLQSACDIWNVEFSCRCRKCGSVFKRRLAINNYYKYGTASSCQKCHPSQSSSKAEKDIIDFLVSAGIDKTDIRLNSRSIIKPYELDIYIESKKLAIEYDGLYWHCHKNIDDKYYHKIKTDMCEKAGVRLVHIFESEWLQKQDIVKSRLKNMLGIYEKTLFARKCEIKAVPAELSKKFQNENHLQGAARSSVDIGLYSEGELVSLMTFGKPRFSRKYQWELIRFCNKLGYHIPGAASKLFAYFEKSYGPESIVSYADRKWSQGNVYEKLGFTFDHVSNPDYWYWNYNVGGHILESRMKFQKHRLSSLLEKYDSALTEKQNMENNGYYRIYDCGNLVYFKKNVSKNI